jgi:hypothetical protein
MALPVGQGLIAGDLMTRPDGGGWLIIHNYRMAAVARNARAVPSARTRDALRIIHLHVDNRLAHARPGKAAWPCAVATAP